MKSLMIKLFAPILLDMFVAIARKLATRSDNHIDDDVVDAIERMMGDKRFAGKVKNVIAGIK
jgi:hypothetical protein